MIIWGAMKKIKNILNQGNINKTSKQEKMTTLGQKKSISTKEDLSLIHI